MMTFFATSTEKFLGLEGSKETALPKVPFTCLLLLTLSLIALF